MNQNKKGWFYSAAALLTMSLVVSQPAFAHDHGEQAGTLDLLGPDYEMSKHPLKETTFTLVHDTHMHGNFGDPKGPENIANKFGIANQVRKQFPNSLMVGNGDDMGTSMLTSTSRGQNMVDAFNAGKLDTDTYGNHDFDMGPDRLQELIAESKFTWVSANVVDKRTNDVFGSAQGAKRFVIKEVNGVKIGITGLTELDAPQLTTMGDNVIVQDPVAALNKIIPEMRAAGAQLVVVGSHLASPDAVTLAEQVNGIDVLVGDHAAKEYDSPAKVNGALLWFIGDNFKHVGQINFYIANGKVQDYNYHLYTLKTDAKTDGSTADPAVQAVMNSYYDQLNKDLLQNIGTTTESLDVSTKVQRSKESAIGDYIADAMRSYTGADVALVNGGGIRADRMIPAGQVTKKDIMDTLPFTNFVTKIEVTGDQLYAGLENGVSQIEKGAGRFPQVSNISFTFNPDLAPGARLLDVKVGGKPLDKKAKYTLATVDYVSNGGDGYTMFKNAKVLLDANGGPLLSKLIIDSIQKDQTISPKTQNRVVISNQIPTDYFADLHGIPAAGAIMELRRNGIVSGVDGQHFQPAARITRAEFVSLLTRAMNLPQDKMATPVFSDVQPNDWYFASIMAAYKAGLVLGGNDGMFHANDLLTQDQLTALLGKALTLAGKTATAADLLKGMTITQPTRGDGALVLQQFLHQS